MAFAVSASRGPRHWNVLSQQGDSGWDYFPGAAVKEGGKMKGEVRKKWGRRWQGSSSAGDVGFSIAFV